MTGSPRVAITVIGAEGSPIRASGGAGVQVRCSGSGDVFEMELKPQCAGDLENGGKARVTVGRQCLVEALTAHADAACEFAEVPRSGDRTERLRNERGIIAVFECGLEVCGCVAKVAEVVGTLVWAELLNRVVHGSSIPV